MIHILLSATIPLLITLCFIATGLIEGWGCEMREGIFGDTSPIIQSDSKRKVFTYHQWRVVQTGSWFLAVLAAVLGAPCHWWLFPFLFIGGDRLYTRFLCLVEFHNFLKKQPVFIEGKKEIKRPPVWFDCVAIGICYAVVIFVMMKGI